MTDKEHIEKLAENLKSQGVSLWANRNIGEYLSDEDIEVIRRQAERDVRNLLETLLVDVDEDPNSKETPRRVAAMYVNEIMRGRFQPPPKVTRFPNTAARSRNFYMVGPISVRSICSHHLVPITGSCVIAVNPGEEVIGLSKFNRLVDWVMSRPQIQEEATQQIMKLVIEHTGAAQIAIGVMADHLCCQWRGVKDHSKMLTWAFHGDIENEPAIRQDILTLLGAPKAAE